MTFNMIHLTEQTAARRFVFLNFFVVFNLFEFFN